MSCDCIDRSAEPHTPRVHAINNGISHSRSVSHTHHAARGSRDEEEREERGGLAEHGVGWLGEESGGCVVVCMRVEGVGCVWIVSVGGLRIDLLHECGVSRRRPVLAA